MNKYVNDVDKDFQLCIKLENLLSKFYYVSVIISLILCVKFNNILCVSLIVLHVLYIIADTLNDVVFKNFAENERRKTLISNAYGSDLTDKKAIGYYNNNEKNPIKKLGINVFERTLDYTSMQEPDDYTVKVFLWDVAMKPINSEVVGNYTINA